MVLFLNKCLDDGFIKAKNCDNIQFAFMWANHDWFDIHPCRPDARQNLLYPGTVSTKRFYEICEHLVNNYFSRPNYLKIDNKPYFSIYDVQNFINGFGSLEEARNAMDYLRDLAIKNGFAGVHWNLVAWGNPILPGEKVPTNYNILVKVLGFDSITSYVWIHHVKKPHLQTDYNYVFAEYMKHWDKMNNDFNIPYFPNMTIGWDSSPRCAIDCEWRSDFGYPYTNIIVNNTPENFKSALKKIKDRLDKEESRVKFITINSWNEWTEGSYLEPDTDNQMKYLEAIKSIMQ